MLFLSAFQAMGGIERTGAHVRCRTVFSPVRYSHRRRPSGQYSDLERQIRRMKVSEYAEIRSLAR